MPFGHAQEHRVVRLLGGDGLSALIQPRDHTVLHHIAVRGKDAAFALAHLFSDLAEVQPCVDIVRQAVQLRHEAVFRIKFAEGFVVVCFVGDLTVLHTGGHVDQPLHRDQSIAVLDSIHHHHPLEAVQLPIAE